MQNLFGVVGQRFEFFIAVVRMREFDKFHLVELVLSDETSRVSAGAARFRAEASRVRTVFYRQVFAVEDFVSVQVCYGNFRGRDEEVIGVFDGESVFF